MYTQATPLYIKASRSNFVRNTIMIIAGSLFLFAGFLMSLLLLTITIILIPVVALRLWWRQRFAPHKNSVPNSSDGNIIDAEYTEIDK